MGIDINFLKDEEVIRINDRLNSIQPDGVTVSLEELYLPVTIDVRRRPLTYLGDPESREFIVERRRRTIIGFHSRCSYDLFPVTLRIVGGVPSPLTKPN